MKRANLSKRSRIPEPYPSVGAGTWSRASSRYSPDPLFSYHFKNVRADDSLQCYCLSPASIETISENSASFEPYKRGQAVGIKVRGAGTLRLDFGTEAAGWLEIDCEGITSDTNLTLGVSEYNAPHFVNVGPRSPSKTAVPTAYPSGNGIVTYRLELNEELYEGVRFGFINVLTFGAPFTITNTRLICQIKPVNYDGTFDCDNPMLNRIWHTAAYTVRLNLKRDYLSAILVDRGDRHSWTGDAHPAQISSLFAFGNGDFILRNLSYTACHGNGIESYELYWLMSVRDYHRITGDAAGVRSLLPHIVERLNRARKIYEIIENNDRITEQIDLVFCGWDERLGGGFERPNLPECILCYQFLTIEAMNALSSVLAKIGERGLSEECLRFAEQKTEVMRAVPNLSGALGLHAMAGAVNAGIFGAECARRLVSLAKTPSYSPFNQYFILNAMARLGLYEEAIDSIHEVWGGQIAYGGTTFFEVFRPGWNRFLAKNAPLPNNQAGYTSLCHPWSAGVSAWITENILGIVPTSAGYESFSITPRLGRIGRVSGVVPTPHGAISASFDIRTGQHKIVVPYGCTATVNIPLGGIPLGGDNYELHTFVGGSHEFRTAPYKQSRRRRCAMFRKSEKKASLRSVTLPPGALWRLDFSDDGASPTIPSGLLGTAGIAGEIGAKPALLPPFVRDVRINLAKRLDLGDNRYALCSDDNRACRQTFTVDIIEGENLAARGESATTDYRAACLPRSRTVTLYFEDYGGLGREQTITQFDLETLEMLYPTEVVRNFANGVYLSYRCEGSVRFRIDQTRGENAVLGGIYWE